MVRTLLADLRHGRGLRHRPVALRPSEQRPVAATLEAGGASLDIAGRHVPCSLIPLVVGVVLDDDGERVLAAGRGRLRITDAHAGGPPLATIDLRITGELPLGDRRLVLFGVAGSEVHCAPALRRHWRHALAWRHTHAGARRPGNLQMSFRDVKALNGYYMWPRPVFLVTVRHADRGNIFPMDLVGDVVGGSFLMALRSTSHSVELMRESRRVVVASIPAAYREHAYALGVHHRKKDIDWGALPFAVRPSAAFGFPVPTAALRVRELEVREVHVVGSHTFFVTTPIADDGGRDEPQLCHVSDMYAEWRARRGRPFEAA